MFEVLASKGKNARLAFKNGVENLGELATGVSSEDYIQYIDKVTGDILIKLPSELDLDKTRKKFVNSIMLTTVFARFFLAIGLRAERSVDCASYRLNRFADLAV